MCTVAEVEGEEETLFLAFAAFEERCKEYERAGVIYRYAQAQLPRERAPELFKRFAAFEKKHGRKVARRCVRGSPTPVQRVCACGGGGSGHISACSRGRRGTR